MSSQVVYLIVAALLLCPYDCAVKSALARAVGTHEEIGCCEHCQAESDSNGTSTPKPLEPANDGRCCLCEGAVFDASLRSTQDILFLSTLWAAQVASTAYVEVSQPLRTNFDLREVPPICSGKARRIEMLSLVL
jgi:hypothetical protein